MSKLYEDMIFLPHFQSKTHSPMSIHDRAAQFSPFAALTGYEDAVEESARITQKKIVLSENQLEQLNEKIQFLESNLKQNYNISITYFIQDSIKDGGTYSTIQGYIKKIDTYKKCIIFSDFSKILFENILDIQIDTLKED